jgi:hypothetical protein
MNKKINATKNTSIYLSVLGGISSLGHGIFEILQGNMPTSGLRFEAISQAHRFWEHGGEPALSIIPNYLITGILTTIISLAIIIWAITFIDKKVGLWGLIILTILVLIFGGGFAPPTFMILAIIAASKINKPLVFWKRILLNKFGYTLARLWPLTLMILILCVLFAIKSGIFGFPLINFNNADIALKFLRSFGLVTTFGIGPIVIISAFAFDIHKHDSFIK